VTSNAPFQIHSFRLRAPVIRPKRLWNCIIGIFLTEFSPGASSTFPWWKLSVAPIADVHSGFPYSRLDVLQNYRRYAEQFRAFPTYFSLDAKIYRDITLHIPFLDSSQKAGKIRLGGLFPSTPRITRNPPRRILHCYISPVRAGSPVSSGGFTGHYAWRWVNERARAAVFRLRRAPQLGIRGFLEAYF